MRTIEVLGPGCNNCKRVEANAREAIKLAGVEAEVVHVTDPREIVAHGILSTPGLIIDGRIRSYGRIPSAGDIAQWLSEGSRPYWKGPRDPVRGQRSEIRPGQSSPSRGRPIPHPDLGARPGRGRRFGSWAGTSRLMAGVTSWV
jgi:small redox-active disulfide protein 2